MLKSFLINKTGWGNPDFQNERVITKQDKVCYLLCNMELRKIKAEDEPDTSIIVKKTKTE